MTESLKVEVSVREIDSVQGLIDLLSKHYDQLPKEIVEYCVKNFGGEE